jgi:hypothetical protein
MTQVYIKVTGGFVFAVTQRIMKTKEDAQAYLREFGVTPDNAPSTRCQFTLGEFSYLLSHTLEEIFGDDELKPSQLVADMLPSLGVSKNMTPTVAPAVSAKSGKPLKTRADLHQAYKDAHQPTLPGVNEAPVVTFRGDTVPLKEICQKLNMEPRAARQKLRKMMPDNGKQRWEWSPEEAAKIMGLLKEK